jgi:plastocyanin
VRSLLILVPLALAAAACGGGGSNDEGSAAGGATVQTIQISEKEYSLNPSTISLPKAGTYEFEVSNDGQTTHSLNIEASGGGDEVEAGNIEPGEHKTIKFTFSAGEAYEMYCPIDGHRQQGMEGEIRVGSGNPGGGATTNPEGETTTSEDGMTTTGEDDGGPGY